MKKLLLALSSILAVVLLGLVVAGCSTSSPALTTSVSNASTQNTGIWVTGVGTLTVTPDTAVLDLGVQTQASDVGDAQTQATQAMTSILAVMSKYSIASSDISTQNYIVSPVYSYGQGTQTITGYAVSNSLSVKISNLNNVGSIIAEAVAAGGNATSVTSLDYIVNDPTQDDAAALKLAMANAQNLAAQLANEADVKLGAASYINESGGYTPPTPITFASSGESAVAPVVAVPVSSGSIEIQMTVQVVYSIS
jgi:uncharacterized protein YggE